MKKQIAFHSSYLSYKNWPNSVRIEIGLDYKNRGFLGKYSRFKQQNDLYMFSSNEQTGSTTSVRGVLFKLQQVINIQISIAIELRIIYHTIPRFRPSTII
ncbi:MAG: hypothetical protein GQ532_13055 [Methylomarinum sp.]|nr:hypothetical protein [Methylomarinum sp.]